MISTLAPSRTTLVVVAIALGCARSSGGSSAPSVSGVSVADAVALASRDSIREYRGEWESEFEMSKFRACAGEIEGSIWLAFSPGVLPKFPERANVLTSNTYYLRVLGILRGPAPRRRLGDGYGHGNASDYELVVTRILELKLPDESTCTIPR
jgi:hypothetical protein